MQHSIEKQEEEDREDLEREALVDKCAHLLSSIDRRGYQRSLLRDANAVLENLLMPMSCTWTHKIEPVIRTIPRDIDDMFRTHTHEPDDSPTAGLSPVARRSKDSGVVELSGYQSPIALHRTVTNSRKRSRNSSADAEIPGELSFRMYEEVQERKRQRNGSNGVSFVSVRFCGASSRPTLFDDVPEEKTALLLPVLLPPYVAEGQHVKVSHAQEIARHLGTYDCRHGLPSVENTPAKSGQRARRTHAGRTRLLWSEKQRTKETEERGSEPRRTRPIFRSLISGEKIENGGQRRPRSVTLGIRINGNLISADMTKQTSPLPAMGRDIAYSYSAELIDKAVEDACASGSTAT